MSECLFCDIVQNKAPSEKVLDLEDFVVIKNKHPKAPIHLLVLDKKHREKSDTISGVYDKYWDSLFSAVYQAIKHFGLEKTGYKLVNNGAGYNHFEHEHIHIMGGSETEPGGET